MLRKAMFAFMVAGAALLVTGANAGGGAAVKSGPQAGQDVPGPFHPLNVTGASAGKKQCLYCANGGNPVAVVFARSVTPQVATLLKKLDDKALATKPNEQATWTYQEWVKVLAWHEAHHQGQAHLTFNLYKAAHGIK